MLGGAVLLAATVFVLLALSFCTRGRSGVRSGRLWIGWLGLAMPSAVLLALLIASLAIGAGTLPAGRAAAVIEVTARRYGWEFGYPGGGRTRDVLHMPAGRPVDIRLTAADVIHSLWIPRIAGKMDAIPGHTNVLRIVADRPGTYRGACAEYCGTGHRGHGFTVIAHDDAGWTAFLEGNDAR